MAKQLKCLTEVPELVSLADPSCRLEDDPGLWLITQVGQDRSVTLLLGKCWGH